jgi:hypothetical protein
MLRRIKKFPVFEFWHDMESADEGRHGSEASERALVGKRKSISHDKFIPVVGLIPAGLYSKKKGGHTGTSTVRSGRG